MTKSRSIERALLGVLAAAMSALAWPGCVGTPLPDPPSFASALVSWSTTPQIDALRFVGRPTAVRPGGTTLRITDPPMAGVRVATNADGSFGRIVPGAAGDVFYVELVLADEDLFVGAFTTDATGTLVAAPSGPDDDADGSPNVIDCAPADPTHAGQRCAAACTTDGDCATGQMCAAGMCVARGGCVPVAETCNGLDDDCNGIVDDGDPGGGVACVPTGPGCGVVVCSGAPSCMPVVGTDHETCGNGIDDDCNGIVDDGC